MKKTNPRKLIPFITFALLIISLLALASCRSSEAVAREYISLDYSSLATGETSLKKICVNSDGDVLTVFNYGKNTREDFYYNKKGKLEYSETFELFDPTEHVFDYVAEETKLYETRYVYEGDRIVKAELLLNGQKTRSYDEYEYDSNGKLLNVKCYDGGRIRETYTYGGEHLASVDVGGGIFKPEFDENGNVIRVSYQDGEGSITLEYNGGKPTRTFKTWTERQNIKKSETVYTYYGSGALYEKRTSTSTYDESGVNSVGRSLETSYTYGESGRVVGRTSGNYSHKVTYNEDGNVSRVEYFNGEKLSMSSSIKYGDNGIPTQKDCFNEDDKDPFRVYKYDDKGNLTEYCEYSGTDAILEIRYEYYPSGIKKSETETDHMYGGSSTSTFAENGNKIRKQYGEDVYAEYVSSDICYVFTRDCAAKDLHGDYFLITKRVGPSIEFVENEYNENFSIVKRTERYASGVMEIVEYDGNGRITKITEYDADGNVVKEETRN